MSEKEKEKKKEGRKEEGRKKKLTVLIFLNIIKYYYHQTISFII